MTHTRIQDADNPYRHRDLLASIAAKQSAQRVRVDSQGKPLEPPKPHRYDGFGNLLGPSEPDKA
ncbi:hypothetical protein [Nocardia altamirensis]|uniref:hypothetical protein n=1 Tax=Nocardia altamirensis TaxID=472158 RepID=UPI00083FF1AC|nr:hypothetical protein [Nocardia altamirensis]